MSAKESVRVTRYFRRRKSVRPGAFADACRNYVLLGTARRFARLFPSAALLLATGIVSSVSRAQAVNPAPSVGDATRAGTAPQDAQPKGDPPAGTPPAPPNGQERLVVKPPPVPTGVIPLPQGSPPTGLQRPLPNPAQPLPKADRPLRVSPDLAAVTTFLQSRPITIDEAVSVALYTNRAFANAVTALQRAQGRLGQTRASLNPTLGVNANITEFDAPTTADFGSLGGSSGSAPPPITIVPQFNPVITTAATLPLDLFGTIRAAASQAQFNEVAARIDINRVRNQLAYDVKNAFYNALRAQAQVGVATDTLNNALARLEDANRTYLAGTSPRFDTISAQRDVADAQRALIDAQAQVRLALASLKNTIGIAQTTRLRITREGAVEDPPGVAPPTVPPIGPDGRPISPTGNNPANPANPASPGGNPPLIAPKTANIDGAGGNDATVPLRANALAGDAAQNPKSKVQNGKGIPPEDMPPMPAPPLDRTLAAPRSPSGRIQPLTPPSVDIAEDDALELGPEFTSLLDEAQKTRPEILESEAQISAAQRGIQYARRSQLPSLSLELSYTYTPNATGFTRENQGAATLGVSIPIFDGGLARERVREARADVATAETNRRQAVDQVQLEVQQAYIALVQSRNRVAVANVGLSQAREAYRLARVRYAAGVSIQPTVSPQIELSNAQTSLAQAQTNQVNAVYDYNASRAQLDRAVGRYSYTPNSPGYAAPPPSKTLGTDKPNR